MQNKQITMFHKIKNKSLILEKIYPLTLNRPFTLFKLVSNVPY